MSFVYVIAYEAVDVNSVSSTRPHIQHQSVICMGHATAASLCLQRHQQWNTAHAEAVHYMSDASIAQSLSAIISQKPIQPQEVGYIVILVGK